MKKIYLIRHGQTEYNKNHIVQGGTIDSSLNQTGRLQGQAFYDYYKNIPFDIVYTSALVRTHETVQPFLDLGILHKPLPALNELSFGIYDGQKVIGDQSNQFSQIIKQWDQGATHLKHEGGQSPEDVAKQQQAFISQVKEDDFETALVCMHGRAMRILLSQLLNQSLAEMHNFKHHNTCLYLLTFDGNAFSLEKQNDLQHLEAFKSEEQLIFS